jgi:hypothetical protein
MQEFKEKFGFGKNKKTLFMVVGVLVAIPVVVGFVSALQNRGESKVLAANDVNALVAEVGKLMALPNEEPTIATVSDADKLTDQEFFKKAQDDDKVLIFPKAQKAILYRPSTKQIIEVAFYDPSAATPAKSAEPVVSPTPAINLLDLVNRPSTAPTPQISPTSAPVGQVSPQPSIQTSPIPSVQPVQ